MQDSGTLFSLPCQGLGLSSTPWLLSLSAPFFAFGGRLRLGLDHQETITCTHMPGRPGFGCGHPDGRPDGPSLVASRVEGSFAPHEIRAPWERKQAASWRALKSSSGVMAQVSLFFLAEKHEINLHASAPRESMLAANPF